MKKKSKMPMKKPMVKKGMAAMKERGAPKMKGRDKRLEKESM